MEIELFSSALVQSATRRRRRASRVSALSAGLHLAALALLLAVPVLAPPPSPPRPDVLVRLVYDPPPPPPPPLPRGSPVRARRPQQLPRPAGERIEAPLTVPPDTQAAPDPTAEPTPRPGVPADSQYGSPTGSDLGDPLGEEGGVEGGLPGGVAGGVPGGVPWGTGTGAVFDYDAPPRLVRGTRPAYPQEAFAKKVEGEVLVEILIDASGHVANARVLRSIPALDAAALRCVGEWAFHPAVRHGRPVATIAQAPVRFRIL